MCSVRSCTCMVCMVMHAMLKMQFEPLSKHWLCLLAKKEKKKRGSLTAPLFADMIDLINVNYYLLQLYASGFWFKTTLPWRVVCSLNFQLMWVWGWAVLCPDSESTIKDNLPTNLVQSVRMGCVQKELSFSLFAQTLFFRLLIMIMVSRYKVVRVFVLRHLTTKIGT